MFRKILTVALPAIVVALTLCTTDNSASSTFAGGLETDGRRRLTPDHPGIVRKSRGPAPAPAVGYAPAQLPVCAPCVRTEQRTVLVPELVTEYRKVPATEIRREEREREVIVYKDVPETVQRTRTFTVLERQVRSHQETYTVPKPVLKNVEQTYTVCVPYTETRTRTCTVLKPVYKEVEHKYTVSVPYCEKRTGMRTICRSVPVTRIRTVCVDQGHWELRPACPVCKPYGPRAAAPVAVCKTRVWVPNLVQKQVAYTVDTIQTVQVPYEYQVTLCRPEIRTRTEKVCTLVPTQESYPYEVHLTRTENRSRTVQICEYVPEERTRTVNETVCVPRQKTESYTETVYRRVAEKQIRKETVCVPVCTTREVPVRVCRLVPKTVEVQVAMQPVYCVPTVREAVGLSARR
jgi:YTV protein